MKACNTNLVHELRNADGVGGWAGTAQAKEGCGTSRRIRNVILVVRAVEVLAIPAAKLILVSDRCIYKKASRFRVDLRREENIRTNATSASGLGQRLSIESRFDR